MERDQLGREGDEAQREEREIAHERHGLSLRPSLGRTHAVSTTALVWFRRDLRVHDHPALTAAHRECDRVVPVFVLDPRLLGGRFPSANRAWFLHGCLAELREALRERGADLVIREGRPEEELPALARECGAEAVYFAADVSPFARARDRRGRGGARRAPAARAASSPTTSAPSSPYSVFTPFWRAWQQLPRREIHGAPRALHFPSGLSVGRLPATPEPEARDPFPPGERAARERANRWLRRRPRPLRGAPRPARGRDLRALALPALRLHLAARARGARARARRRGVRPPARVARLLRPRPAPQPGATRAAPTSPSTTGSSGTTTRSCSTPGARAAPAIRSSTPRCASCSTRGWMHNRGAADRGRVPDQGPAPRLAARRGALHAPPAVRRRGLQQRQLAVDRVGRASTPRPTSGACTTR